jgi:hypothetical protein
MHGRSTNLSDDQIRSAFEKMATSWQHERTAENTNREKTA